VEGRKCVALIGLQEPRNPGAPNGSSTCCPYILERISEIGEKKKKKKKKKINNEVIELSCSA